jgi:hypothetical protein
MPFVRREDDLIHPFGFPQMALVLQRDRLPKRKCGIGNVWLYEWHIPWIQDASRVYIVAYKDDEKQT